MGMTKSEVKQALDRIREASAEDIAANWVFIKQVTEAAFGLIKSLESKRKNKLKAVAEKYGLTQDGVDFALSQYQRVICEITHNRMSKLSYYANDILALANDLQCEGCEVKETLDDPNVFVGNWISVKDGLPEEKINSLTQDFQEVICFVDFGGKPRRTDIRTYGYGKRSWENEPHFWHGPQIMDGIVTHWMYFPEEPKEESKNG